MGTHKNGYVVLDAYCYMLESTNLKSKTALQVDENGRFKYFLYPMVLGLKVLDT